MIMALNSTLKRKDQNIIYDHLSSIDMLTGKLYKHLNRPLYGFYRVRLFICRVDMKKGLTFANPLISN